MQLGPFKILDVENIKAIFETKKVQYDIFIDEELQAAAAGSMEEPMVFFEFSDNDFEKIKTPLENFGIMLLSDGSYELGEE